MQFNPLVTLIVPAYNHEKYILECLESLLAQKYENLEIIILNDGSKDNTHNLIVSVLEKLKLKFKNVIYLNKENEGVTKTLNRGIALANGDYFLSIASDDFLTCPDAVSALVSVLDNEPHDSTAVICGDMSIVNSNSRRLGWDIHRNNVDLESDRPKFLTTTEYYAHWRKGFDGFDYLSEEFGSYNSIIIGHYMPNGCLLKKKAVLEVGGYSSEVIIEDWDMWLKLSKNYKFKFVPKVLYAYRWHGANTQVLAEKKIRRNILQLVINEKDYCYSTNRIEIWNSAFRLARSGMAGNGDFLYLSKVCRNIGQNVFIDNLILMLFHQVKRIIKRIVSPSTFNKIKVFIRGFMKPSVRN